jgi:hypothetical protein
MGDRFGASGNLGLETRLFAFTRLPVFGSSNGPGRGGMRCTPRTTVSK